MKDHGASTLSYCTPLMWPPLMEFFTLCRNCSRFLRSSSAASASRGRNNEELRIDTVMKHIPLLSGSSAFGSRNRYCSPTNTEFKFNTGFQSSRRIFKQTFPSRSTLGWYIFDEASYWKSCEVQWYQTYCLCTLDLWWFVRVVAVNIDREVERATLVHAFVHGGESALLNDQTKKELLPSSGVIVRVKLSRSAGSGKLVFIVEDSSSSVRSNRNIIPYRSQSVQDTERTLYTPFCTRI